MRDPSYTKDPILRRLPKIGVYFTLVTRVGKDLKTIQSSHLSYPVALKSVAGEVLCLYGLYAGKQTLQT